MVTLTEKDIENLNNFIVNALEILTELDIDAGRIPLEKAVAIVEDKKLTEVFADVLAELIRAEAELSKEGIEKLKIKYDKEEINRLSTSTGQNIGNFLQGPQGKEIQNQIRKKVLEEKTLAFLEEKATIVAKEATPAS